MFVFGVVFQRRLSYGWACTGGCKKLLQNGLSFPRHFWKHWRHDINGLWKTSVILVWREDRDGLFGCGRLALVANGKRLTDQRQRCILRTKL